MAQTTKTNIYNNSYLHPVKFVGQDFSECVREDFHMEVVDGTLIPVSDGITDYNKVVQSHENEAGLKNIIKLQTLRYGTLDNAIARNKEKQTFADVSKVPDSVAEQQALVAKTNAEVDKLCKELGITKDQLLNLTAEKYAEIKKAQADAAAAAQAATEGGAE